MQTHVRRLRPRRLTASFQSGRKERTQRSPACSPLASSLEPAERSPPRSKVADLPSSRHLISASLEATPRHKGQTALPLTHPSYGGIKCQPLLHSAQDRRRQAAIPHSGCDRSPIRQLRSLLRHPGRCGNTVGPATWDEARSAQFCYYSANSGRPDSTSSHVWLRAHLLLGRGSGVATSPSKRDAHHSQPESRISPLEGSGTSTCLPDLLVCTSALRPGGPEPPRGLPSLKYAGS